MGRKREETERMRELGKENILKHIKRARTRKEIDEQSENMKLENRVTDVFMILAE